MCSSDLRTTPTGGAKILYRGNKGKGAPCSMAAKNFETGLNLFLCRSLIDLTSGLPSEWTLNQGYFDADAAHESAVVRAPRRAYLMRIGGNQPGPDVRGSLHYGALKSLPSLHPDRYPHFPARPALDTGRTAQLSSTLPKNTPLPAVLRMRTSNISGRELLWTDRC